MKQSIPVPVAAAVIVVVVLIAVVVLWRKYAAPSTASPGTAMSTGASQAPPPDMQKNANPRDLAKQYGYSR